MAKRRSLTSLIRNANRFTEVLRCMQITDQWWDLTTMYLGLRPPKFPFLFKTRQGQSVEINTFHDLITVWVIFCRQEYKVPAGAKVVIDAGANIGTFSIFASGSQVRTIHAIEPFPETFSLLQKNIENNNLGDVVELNSIALADTTGSRKMDMHEGPSQSRGLLAADDSEGLEVQTFTLKDFLDQKKLDEVDLLKIDIEGGEHQVFLSSSPDTLKRIKNIAMEYHPNQPKEPLFEKIIGSDFTLTHDFKISHASGVAYFTRN